MMAKNALTVLAIHEEGVVHHHHLLWFREVTYFVPSTRLRKWLRLDPMESDSSFCSLKYIYGLRLQRGEGEIVTLMKRENHW